MMWRPWVVAGWLLFAGGWGNGQSVQASAPQEAPVKGAPVKEAPVKGAPVKDASVKDASVKDAPVTLPVETGSFRPSELVEIVQLDPSIKLDIRYATANNFVGRPVYDEPRAFLQRPAAEALVKAHRWLKAHGYGIVVFDGYRPWRVTKLFWELTPPDKRDYVADPSKGSLHNRGCAVDVSLYDLNTGELVTMPSDYDEMSERAHPDYTGGTEEQRRLRDLLRTAMELHDFKVYRYEWWHFDHKDWRQYRVQDIPFSEIPASGLPVQPGEPPPSNPRL